MFELVVIHLSCLAKLSSRREEKREERRGERREKNRVKREERLHIGFACGVCVSPLAQVRFGKLLAPVEKSTTISTGLQLGPPQLQCALLLGICSSRGSREPSRVSQSASQQASQSVRH